MSCWPVTWRRRRRSPGRWDGKTLDDGVGHHLVLLLLLEHRHGHHGDAGADGDAHADEAAEGDDGESRVDGLSGGHRCVRRVVCCEDDRKGVRNHRQHRTSRAQDLRAVGRSFAFPANREIRVRATAAERRERDVSKSRAGAVANRARDPTREAATRAAAPFARDASHKIRMAGRDAQERCRPGVVAGARARRRARDREKHTRRDATRRTSRRLGDPKIPVVSKGGRWTCVWRVTTEPRRRGGKRKRKRAAERERERGWFVLGCLVTVWFVCHEIFDVRYWSVCYSKKIGGPSNRQFHRSTVPATD